MRALLCCSDMKGSENIGDLWVDYQGTILCKVICKPLPTV